MRVLLVAALLCTARAAVAAPPPPQPGTRVGRFQPMPRDPSMQPLPAKTTGQIDFVGNTTFTADQLKEPMTEQIKEINEQGLTRPRADDAAFYLESYYRKQGFPNAEVKWDIIGDRLRLTVHEGRRTYLRHVNFIGNKAIDRKTLYEYMIGGTEERDVKKKTPAIPFVESDMTTGVARLRGYYESEGRLDAKIEEPEITYTPDHSAADVTVRIQEGPRYTFGQIDFVGEPAFGRDQLINGLGEPLTNPYTTQRVNTMEHNLLYYYKTQGYYAATVNATADPKKFVPGPLNNRRVPVVFHVQAGPVYHFDGVTVKGLDRLKPGFFEHRFADLRGKVYTPPLLDEKYRELLSTGLFKNLRIEQVALPTNEVRADFTAEEAKAKEIGFSLGFSTYEGAIVGLHLADRDLYGNGRPLSLDIDYSQRGLKAELLYVDPWFLESKFALRARIFAQSRIELGYEKGEQGLRADLTRKLNPNVEFGTFVQGKNVNVTSEVIDPIYLGPTAYQVISLGLTQSFDFRQPRENPIKGYIVTSSLDAGAIAGELAFGRASVRVTYFTQVFSPRYILALGARGGVILPFTEVPIDERFFNGGANSVRSFRERELGPREPHGNPIGGEAFTIFNAELTFPLKDALRGAVFIDAGNLAAEHEHVGLTEMRYAVGLGLRYALPFGPVRLDVGVNPDPKMDEKWGAVHFSIGLAF
jgi:outer membrane protein assembly complex protein YaeT